MQNVIAATPLNVTDEWEQVVNSRSNQLRQQAQKAVRRTRTRRGLRLSFLAVSCAAAAFAIFAVAPQLISAAYVFTCAACFFIGRFVEFFTRPLKNK